MNRKLAVLLLVLALLPVPGAFSLAEETAEPSADPLYGYRPKRENEINWETYVYEAEGDEDDDEVTPEYEATYSGGRLQELTIEIELDDGSEYEVTYNSKKQIIRAEYETDDGEFYFDGSVWTNGDGETVEGPDLSFMYAYYKAYSLKGIWFGGNTMSLVGLSLREMYPELTNKWYHVVPVDLTREGTYRYRTAVSNMYYMGSCIVTVENGTVTTDYVLPHGHVEPESHCLMWFTDVSQITTEFLENPVGAYQFGKPVSIRDDLKGQEIALLFICNRLTYRVPLNSAGGMPYKFYVGRPSVRKLISEYKLLFNRMQELYAPAADAE